jgi:KTSC domain
VRRQKVKSSMISEIGYDAATQVLEIKFSGSGGVYQYESFSPEDWIWFQQQESIGKHFGAEIRGKFKSKKMEPEDAQSEQKTSQDPNTQAGA